jgi:hypothetical protein
MHPSTAGNPHAPAGERPTVIRWWRREDDYAGGECPMSVRTNPATARASMLWAKRSVATSVLRVVLGN